MTIDLHHIRPNPFHRDHIEVVARFCSKTLARVGTAVDLVFYTDPDLPVIVLIPQS